MKVIKVYDGWFEYLFDLLLEKWIIKEEIPDYSKDKFIAHFGIVDDNEKDSVNLARDIYLKDNIGDPEFINDVRVQEL